MNGDAIIGGSKVFVGNISDMVRKNELRSEFERFGEVADVYISDGYGFVTFVARSSAAKAIEDMNGAPYMGKKLKVELSRGKKVKTYGNYRPPEEEFEKHDSYPRGGEARGGYREHREYHRDDEDHHYERRVSPPPRPSFRDGDDFEQRQRGGFRGRRAGGGFHDRGGGHRGGRGDYDQSSFRGRGFDRRTSPPTSYHRGRGRAHSPVPYPPRSPPSHRGHRGPSPYSRGGGGGSPGGGGYQDQRFENGGGGRGRYDDYPPQQPRQPDYDRRSPLRRQNGHLDDGCNRSSSPQVRYRSRSPMDGYHQNSSPRSSYLHEDRRPHPPTPFRARGGWTGRGGYRGRGDFQPSSRGGDYYYSRSRSPSNRYDR